ncbi:uncharacterized protein LOC121087890 [Falco naumanni]|uniref:uncharacterized protein LOC121087890 n=1 Tax=Falco naumanni TaxID=148594 RepID=UPI001ADEA33C|nr:uncharacterized protein LOC121087890 [Falco naumanni]
MALLQAPSDAQFSHARCCSGSWGSRWALAGTMEEQGEQPVRCGARGLSAVPAASIQAWPCPGVLALPELMAGASAAPLQLPLRVFQMVGCTDLSEELDCALAIFPTYLQSQCLGMPTLVLRAILRLTERPDTARKTLVLLPYVMERLQADDSDDSAVALSVLDNMLQLPAGKKPSLIALALADKLQPLFDNVRLAESPMLPSLSTSFASPTAAPMLCRRMLCPAAPSHCRCPR